MRSPLRTCPRQFFLKDTVTVAQNLLGCGLYFQNTHFKHPKLLIISETEAYLGVGDHASHAHRGQNPRYQIMFGQPGLAYVYFIYGMYHCLNVVTEPNGQYGAVLIRGAIDIQKSSWINGPGRLCKYLGITREDNGRDLVKDPEFSIKILRITIPLKVHQGKRVGISRAQTLPYRFFFGPKQIKQFLKTPRSNTIVKWA